MDSVDLVGPKAKHGGNTVDGEKGGCMHNDLLVLEGLNVCECILQHQHLHHWLSLISIKKCCYIASDGKEGVRRKGGRVRRESEIVILCLTHSLNTLCNWMFRKHVVNIVYEKFKQKCGS